MSISLPFYSCPCLSQTIAKPPCLLVEHPSKGRAMFCVRSWLSGPLRAAISQADLGQLRPLHNSSGFLTGSQVQRAKFFPSACPTSKCTVLIHCHIILYSLCLWANIPIMITACGPRGLQIVLKRWTECVNHNNLFSFGIISFKHKEKLLMVDQCGSFF